MKIVYATTVTINESLSIMEKNINLLNKLDNIDLTIIVNTAHKIDLPKIIKINEVGDMKSSREAILKEAAKHEADAYFIFDSDIELPSIKLKEFITSILAYKNQYDFVALYYKLDPPIPAFFTLASSLNDFYNFKINKQEAVDIPFFDDSNFDSSSYLYPNKSIPNKHLQEILRGRSFMRDIPEFTNIVDENDTTTGGSNVYFKKSILEPVYSWPKYENKSLTWYDSYRTWKLSQKYKFAKVPIFVNHRRHQNNIQLNWNAVIKYVKGFNLYNKYKDKNFNEEALPLHVVELYMFIRGMVKKINILKNLKKDEIDVIKKIEIFLNINIKEIYERI